MSELQIDCLVATLSAAGSLIVAIVTVYLVDRCPKLVARRT